MRHFAIVCRKIMIIHFRYATICVILRTENSDFLGIWVICGKRVGFLWNNCISILVYPLFYAQIKFVKSSPSVESLSHKYTQVSMLSDHVKCLRVIPLFTKYSTLPFIRLPFIRNAGLSDIPTLFPDLKNKE